MPSPAPRPRSGRLLALLRWRPSIPAAARSDIAQPRGRRYAPVRGVDKSYFAAVLVRTMADDLLPRLPALARTRDHGRTVLAKTFRIWRGG